MWFLFCVLFVQEMRQHMMSPRRQGQCECRSAGMSTPKSKALKKINSEIYRFISFVSDLGGR